MNLRVLVACEYSGRVREAFRAKGFDAWSCDLIEAEDASPYHIQGDVRSVLSQHWDLMIAHPDCTYLCSSGLHWNGRTPGRAELTEQALQFVQLLMGADIEHIAIENPVGCISTRIKQPSQTIQPNEYGDDASKKTCLWLKNLPKLKPTKQVEPRLVCCGQVIERERSVCPICNGKYQPKQRWSNQTDSGQNRLPPSPDRWKERSRTYQGWADAMADQWGGYLVSLYSAMEEGL